GGSTEGGGSLCQRRDPDQDQCGCSQRNQRDGNSGSGTSFGKVAGGCTVYRNDADRIRKRVPWTGQPVGAWDDQKLVSGSSGGGTVSRCRIWACSVYADSGIPWEDGTDFSDSRKVLPKLQPPASYKYRKAEILPLL